MKAWNNKDWDKEYPVDKAIGSLHSKDYDALILPGGVMNPDQLRMNTDVVNFVSDFLDKGKPIAAICHGPWKLVETGKLKRKTITSYPSLKTDLINAGAQWVDKEVVVDGGLVPVADRTIFRPFAKK